MLKWRETQAASIKVANLPVKPESQSSAYRVILFVTAAISYAVPHL